MFIVEVIPLTILPKNVPQILSYFFDLELTRGAIVEVILNKRKIKAVVISSKLLEKEKLALKRVDFQIKKLSKVLYEKPQISDYQLKIAIWIAKYYHAPLGYTLKIILPHFAFKKKFPLTATTQVVHRPASQVGYPRPQLFIYKTKRLTDYLKPLVQETGDKQVLIMVSEKLAIKYFYDYFSKKYNVSIVSSGLSDKELHDSWIRARSGESKIIIGTRQALNMNFKDLGLIIVDDPNYEFYKSDMVPRYNAVKLAYKVAELNRAQLVLASVIPNIENYHKIKNDIYELKNLESRPKFETEIIDMAQEKRNGNWSPISKNLNKEIITRLENNKKVLIFSPRRGYAGILICESCGSAVKCPQCEVAMRIHRSVEMILACHHCGISKPMPKNCPVCENHNLKTIGPAGTQKIYEEIRHRLIAANMKFPVLVLDTDIVKNETEEEEITSEIRNVKAAILVATQMVFSHRFYLNFDLIAIVNADALTNMPDFKSEENLFYQIEKLVNFEPKKLIIQTYNPESKIIKKAVSGDYTDFYDNELKLRKTLSYPPFYQLTKLTFRHKDKDKASYAARIITEKLKMAITRARLTEKIKLIEATPAYIEREKGLYAYNIFLKIQENHEDASNLLKYIGPGWIIDVDPRSLL